MCDACATIPEKCPVCGRPNGKPVHYRYEWGHWHHYQMTTPQGFGCGNCGHFIPAEITPAPDRVLVLKLPKVRRRAPR